MFDFEEELRKLPAKPGVYLMHDQKDVIIYVGKAVSLKNRVRQYFQASRNVSPKIERMIQQIAYFEYIITDSEVEALVLECNLIKEHSPRYNTMLKDDKSYPYIKATIQEPFPRLLFAHQRRKDQAKYFGPYTSSGAIKETLDFLRKMFYLRNCKKNIQGDAKEGRPCLYYHIDQCKGPCQCYVSKEDYNKNFQAALAILNGNTAEVIQMLTNKMREASEMLEFEEAGKYRDQIETIKRIAQKQKATGNELEDRDVIAVAISENEAVVQVFFIRSGKMIGREHHYLTGIQNEAEAGILGAFIKQYYADTPFVPRELMVPCDIDDSVLIEQWLTERKGQRVYIKTPKIGDKSKLTQLAKKNAELVLSQDAERIRREHERTTGAMNELTRILGLDEAYRVESFDISNMNGFESVGSMVVFEQGKPRKHEYRKFRIRTVSGPDDYSSMREVLTRRFRNGVEKHDSFCHLPDIVLMDGGKGQVNIAKEVLDGFGLDIPICGMVKDDHHRTRGLYYNNQEFQMDSHSEVFKLLTRIQDETHRFAIEYHRNIRSKEQVHSILDEVSGIGDTRRKALMKYFKSLEAIREATIDELLKVEGMNRKVAENVYRFFREEQKTGE